MRNPHELGDRARGEVLVEFVGGTRDGDRQYAPVVVHAGETVPDASTPVENRVSAVGETYLRRGAAPERCGVDGLLVWHYDLERPVRRARPAPRRNAEGSA